MRLFSTIKEDVFFLPFKIECNISKEESDAHTLAIEMSFIKKEN